MKHAHRFHPGVSLAGLWLCAVLMTAPASATPVLDTVPTIENIRARLNLSPEQEEQLRPIFEQRKSELQSTQHALQQAGSRQAKHDVLRAAKQQAEAFNTKVEAVLSPSQKNDWREIRSEVREKTKERYEDKHSQ